MSDQEKPLFQGMDEYERTYAPEELAPDDPERQRAAIDDDDGGLPTGEPPAPAPVGTLGTSPSGVMAPPNIGHEDHGGAPGDPETEARYPIGNPPPPPDDPTLDRPDDLNDTDSGGN